MAFTTIALATGMLFLLAVFIGGILMQIYLSKQDTVWPGLILPGISFLFSLVYPLNMMVPAGGIHFGYVISVIGVWVIANIPTFALTFIYFAQRKKQRELKELEQMMLQDL